MAAKKRTKGKSVPVESLRHKDKRKNTPTEELWDFVKEDEAVNVFLLLRRKR